MKTNFIKDVRNLTQLLNGTTPKEIKENMGFAHKGRKPKNLTTNELMDRYFQMFNTTCKIFKSPYKWFKDGWNCIDIGLLLLGSEQLDKQLFPPHRSGKNLLDRTNPFVVSCIEEAIQYMEEENLVLIEGLVFEKEVA